MATPLRTVGEGLLIVLFYGLFLWRLTRSKPEKRLEECGHLTLVVFIAVVLVGSPRNVPSWLFETWVVLVVLHCFVTLYFLFLRIFNWARRHQ